MSSSRAVPLLALAAGLAVIAGGGCSVKNPDFCCSTVESCSQAGAGAIVACANPAEPYCDDQGAYGPARACIADPQTTACHGPDDCPTPALPVCDADDTGTCVGCASDDDCTRFAGTQRCDVTGSHACVVCVSDDDCGSATPVCGADHTCRACGADGECASGVCAQGGTCPAAADVIYVDAAAAASNTDCTQAAPCHTIALGVAKIDATRRTMRIAPAAAPYAERVVLDGKTVDLVATGAELTSTIDPVLDVVGGSVVTIRGLDVNRGMGRGVHCNGASVTLREAEVEMSVGRGIDATDCTLTVERSRILDNNGGGIAVSSGRTTIRNTFIGKNGNVAFSVGGVYVMDPFDLTFEFNTVVDNFVSNAGAAGLNCSTGSAVTVTNNIIVGGNPNQVDATTCAPTYTLSNELVTGTGNLMGSPTFRNAGARDYHLLAGSMGIDQADPAATLDTDIDGESRPAGAHADLGADELH
ncbi:MAG TPA: right-handed parallel beta-helix repeat-containing protein [Kofleriaceae bacterium]|nr:right-handed parallel beta-helix repeat-containing protein [Kofleriaceae bacterium]